MNAVCGRSSTARSARRAIVVAFLVLAAAFSCGSSGQAAAAVPGPLGGEVLGNPVPAPGPGPNVFPLPPPRPGEPGFVPAPVGPEAQVRPVPVPRGGTNDGPGSGPTVPPPVRVDADTPGEDANGSGGTASTGDPEPVGTLTLDPAEIRQSQTSVNDVAEVEASMRADGWVGKPIDVVRMPDGGLTTVDNTRLLAAKRAGIDVHVTVHNFKDPIPEPRAVKLRSRKGLLPRTWGEAVLYRIGRQIFEYRSRYPSGSPITGWRGN